MFFNNESSSENEEGTAKLSDLCYYFDSVECDRLDQGALGRKAAQVLTLRQKLLSLPEPEFDAAIKTLEKLVEVKSAAAHAAQSGRISPSRREAIELFERTSESANRVPAPEKVSRV